MLAFTSCSDDIAVDISRPDFEGEINISYEIDGDMPLSRGVVTQSHENRLEKVYVLFFDLENEEMFAGAKAVGVTPGKGVLSFDAPEGVQTDRSYRLLAVGNADSFNDDEAFTSALKNFSGSYTDALGTFMAVKKKPVTLGNVTSLPMWGEYQDENGKDAVFTLTVDETGNKVVKEKGRFRFSRAICRLDIHNLVGHVLDIRCARVVNSRTAGYLFIEGLNAGDQPELSPAAAPDGEGYMPITMDMTPGTNTTQRLEGSLYAFPNITATSVVNDNRTTALMIAGYYIDPETGVKDTELTYYRFNYANAGEAQVLKRNYCYRATIKGVRGRGASSEKEAFNSSTPMFEYDVDEEWGTTDDNVVSDKDGNFLIVNKTHLTFQGEVSEADFVELRVSTNPELEWEAEWVNEEGNENGKFSFEKLSDRAVKCGPLEKNESPYVRYGYLRIKGRNPATGAVLYMPIYLMQLSTLHNVKTLTVNGNTGTFTQELNPMGGSVSFPVVTGGASNAWSVADDGNMLSNWDVRGVSFTDHGSNGTTLEITVPANITGKTRTATLIVSLDENETNPDGSKKVPDVIINLIQEPSKQLMDVINMPSSGRMDLQCFSMTPGNPSGVVSQRNFIVKLTDPRYRYRVKSSFDKNRDLVLSAASHRGIGSASPAYAVQPENGAVVTDLIEGLENGVQFWINPFRTGPNDPAITGTITVEAYPLRENFSDLDDAAFALLPREERSFTVRLLSEPVEINDVFMDAGNGSYHIIADRNYGAPSRVQEDGSTQTAAYYDYREYCHVTNASDPVNNSSFRGTDTRSYNWWISKYDMSQAMDPTPEVIQQRWKDANVNVNRFYSEGRFTVTSSAQWTAIANRTCYSKQRAFIASDLKKKNGKSVCCWFPFFLTKCTWEDGRGSDNWCRYMVPVNSRTKESGGNTFTIFLLLSDKGQFYISNPWYSRLTNQYHVPRMAMTATAEELQELKEIYGLQ